MIIDAAMGCDITYAEAEALDKNEAKLCRTKKYERSMLESSKSKP